MILFNWLFGRKKKVPYNPLVEFGTGPIIIPKSDYGRAAIGLMTQDGVFAPFKKQNTNTMIDPNHPAFPVVAFDSRGDLTTTEDLNGLTIRAEIAARILAATIRELVSTPNQSDIEWHVRTSFRFADEFIKQLNETT